MPPKNKFTKEKIIDVAFDIAKTAGMESITIRKVAEKLGSSIAPIYVNFNDINELKQAVIGRISEMSKQMILDQNSGNPFYDIGIVSLNFARDYSILFRELMLKNNDYFRNYNDNIGDLLVEQMKKDSDLKNFTTEELKTILLKMRIFQLGLSIMVANKLLPEEFTEEDEVSLLENTATDIIYSTNYR